MNTRTLVCLTALLVSAFSFAEAQDVVSLPKETPYADDATGAVFPARIGSFAKTNVTKNLNPYYGTVIRYANDYGSSADVYIYALDLKTVNLSAEQWRKHYDEVKGNIVIGDPDTVLCAIKLLQLTVFPRLGVGIIDDRGLCQ